MVVDVPIKRLLFVLLKMRSRDEVAEYLTGRTGNTVLLRFMLMVVELPSGDDLLRFVLADVVDLVLMAVVTMQ